MSKQHNSVMILTILILCMVSVWIAPVLLGIGTHVMEFTEADSDMFEFEEELILADRGINGMIHTINFRIGGTYLNILPASLARVFSPPKPFYS
jgi:hypothetical protein